MTLSELGDDFTDALELILPIDELDAPKLRKMINMTSGVPRLEEDDDLSRGLDKKARGSDSS